MKLLNLHQNKRQHHDQKYISSQLRSTDKDRNCNKHNLFSSFVNKENIGRSENYSSHIKKPNLNIKQRKNGEQIDKKCDEIIKDKTIEQKITRKEFPVFNLNKPSFLSTGPFKSVERPIDYDPLLKTSSRWRNKQNDEKQQINKNKLNESDIINLEIDNNKRTNLFDQSNKEEKSENEYVELYNLQQMNILCSMNNSTQSQIDISSYNQNTNECFQETSAILYKPSLHSQNSTQSQLNQNQKS